jgi:hypothetical protein
VVSQQVQRLQERQSAQQLKTSYGKQQLAKQKKIASTQEKLLGVSNIESSQEYKQYEQQNEEQKRIDEYNRAVKQINQLIAEDRWEVIAMIKGFASKGVLKNLARDVLNERKKLKSQKKKLEALKLKESTTTGKEYGEDFVGPVKPEGIVTTTGKTVEVGSVLVKPSEVSSVKTGVSFTQVGEGRDILVSDSKGGTKVEIRDIDGKSTLELSEKTTEGINVKQPNIIQEKTLIGEWMGVTSPYDIGGSQYGIEYPKGQEPIIEVSKIPQYVEAGLKKGIELVSGNKDLDVLDAPMFGGWLGDFVTSQGGNIPSTLDVLSYPSRKVDEVVDLYKDYSAQEDNIFTFGLTEEQKANTQLRSKGRFYREEIFATAMRLTPYLIPYIGVALSITDIAKGVQQIRNPEDEKKVVDRVVNEVYNQYSLDYENEKKNLAEGYELEPKLTKEEIRELISQEILTQIQMQGALNIVGGVGDVIGSGARVLFKKYVPRKKFLGMSEKQFEKFQVNKLKSEEMLADLGMETSKYYKERYKLLTGLNYLEEPTEGFIKTINTEYIGTGKKVLTAKEIKEISTNFGLISKELDTPLQLDEVGKFNIESEIGITKRLKLIGGEGLDIIEETELPSLSKFGFPEKKISQRVLLSTTQRGDEILGGGISYVLGSQDKAINKQLFTLYGKGKRGVLFEFYDKGRKSKYFQETDAGKLLIEYEPFAVITKRQLTKSKKILGQELDDEIVRSIYKTKYLDIPTARENVDVIDFVSSLKKKKLKLKGYSRGEKLSEYINIPTDKSLKLDIDISGTDLKSSGRGKVIDVTEYVNIGKQYPRGTIFTGTGADDITGFTGSGKKSSQQYLQQLYQENLALPEIQIKPPRVKAKPTISKVAIKSGFDIPLVAEKIVSKSPTLSINELEYPSMAIATSIKVSQLNSQVDEQELKSELGVKVKWKHPKNKENEISRERDLDVSSYLTKQTQQQMQSQLQKSEQSSKLKSKQIQDIIAPEMMITTSRVRRNIEPPDTKIKFRFDLPEQKQLKEKQKPTESFNVYVKVPKKKSYSKITNKPVSRKDAENLRAFAIDESTSRQGYIKRVKTKPSKLPYDIPNTYSKDTDFKFRTFQQKKGKRIPLINRVIEKSKYIQDTRNEKKDLSVFRLLARKEKKKLNKINQPFGLGFA